MAKEKIKEEEKIDEYEELTLEDRVTNIEKKVNWTFGLTIVITIISVLILIFVLAGDTERAANNGNESGNGAEVAEEIEAFKIKTSAKTEDGLKELNDLIQGNLFDYLEDVAEKNKKGDVEDKIEDYIKLNKKTKKKSKCCCN